MEPETGPPPATTWTPDTTPDALRRDLIAARDALTADDVYHPTPYYFHPATLAWLTRHAPDWTGT